MAVVELYQNAAAAQALLHHKSGAELQCISLRLQFHFDDSAPDSQYMYPRNFVILVVSRLSTCFVAVVLARWRLGLCQWCTLLKLLSEHVSRGYRGAGEHLQSVVYHAGKTKSGLWLLMTFSWIRSINSRDAETHPSIQPIVKCLWSEVKLVWLRERGLVARRTIAPRNIVMRICKILQREISTGGITPYSRVENSPCPFQVLPNLQPGSLPSKEPIRLKVLGLIRL